MKLRVVKIQAGFPMAGGLETILTLEVQSAMSVTQAMN